jgi:PAS domain S-box-containing protein
MSKILLIDDKIDNLVALSALLKNLMPGCVVITAQSGIEGIEKAGSEFPDAILLDVKMPGMDGFQTCRRLKSDESTKHIPVIMITAIKTDPQSRVEGLEIGADAFLAKPIDQYELVSQVKVALRIKEAEDALREERDSLESLAKKRTAALVEEKYSARDFLESVINTIADPVFVKDDKRNFVLVNEALCTIVGRPREDLLGEDGDDMFPEEEVAIFREMDAAVLDTGEENVNEEFLSNLTTGEVRTIVTRKTRYIDPKKNHFLVGVVRDITELKQAEEITNKAHGLLKIAEKLAHIGSWEWDIQEDEFTMSDEWLQIHGITNRNLTMDELIPIAHPDDVKFVEKNFKDALDGVRPYDLIHRIIRQDNGEERVVHAKGIVNFDKKGKPYRVQGTAQDITEKVKSERALKESENRFRSMFEYHSAVMLLIEPESGNILDSNKSATNFYGYTRKEITSMNISDINTLKSEEVKNNIKRAEAKDINLFNFKHRLKDNTLRDVQVHSTPIKYMNKILLFSIIYDTTKHKLAEKKIIETKQFYENIIEGVQDGIWVTDGNDVIYFANKAMGIIAGIPPEEIQGRNVLKDFSRETTGDLIDFYNQAKKDKKPVWYEIEVKTPSNRNTWQNGWLIPQYEDNTFKGIICTINDITERKQAEEELNTSRDLLGSVLENIPIRIFWKDTDLRYLGCNTPFALDAGMLHPEDLIGKDDLEMSWSEEAELYRSDDKHVIDSDTQKLGYEESQTTPDGHKNLLRSSKVPLHDAKGKVIGLLGIYEDITESRQAEEAAALLEEQYNQSQKLESIGRLAGGVSHDLNNLLTPILGYSEMLIDDLGPDDKRREAVDEIMKAGVRARGLVRQLLAFSRKQTLEYRPVDLNRALSGFEKLLRRTIRADIEIKIILSPDIRTVMADIGQIEQVIMNLVVNAQDAMPEGGRLIIETAPVDLDKKFAKTHQGTKPGEYVMLTISDTGCGMDEELMGNIFEPFFSTKGELGTGLGLATVYGIVKQHDGNIWAYSEPGKGTTFKVYLPAFGGVPGEEIISNETPASLAGAETILLAEDNEQVRKLAHTILKRHGYTVLMAENGPEALTILASHDGPVDLLITDVVMPGMDGRKLFEKIAEKHPDTKVLYMSGYTDNTVAHCGVLDEGTTFIQKPFTVLALAAKVREVLGD